MSGLKTSRATDDLGNGLVVAGSGSTSRRTARGGMIALVVLVLCLIVAICLIGFTFNSILFKHTSAQHKVDLLALSLASSINASDRVGQMNDLESCCRELVYVSRKHYQDCVSEDFQEMSPLCWQLLCEAHEGQARVEEERSNLARAIVSEMQTAAAKHNRDCSNIGASILAWMQMGEPKIMRIEVGRLANTESNVKSLCILQELAEYDAQRNYLQAKTNLFRADINARLPDPEAGLDFKISGLPSYVVDTCSPARNINPEVFIGLATVYDGQPLPILLGQLPSAIRLSCSMDASIGTRREYQGTLYVSSAALTNGAIASSDQ